MFLLNKSNIKIKFPVFYRLFQTFYNILINNPMLKTKLKWTLQDDQLIQKLQQQFRIKTKINWIKLAEEFNQKRCLQKSPKQCKERYYSLLRTKCNSNMTAEWTSHQLSTLMRLYIAHGCSWAYFTTQLQNKSQTNIKNKFYNKLKGAVKSLGAHIAQTKSHKWRIDFQVINILLLTFNQIQKWVRENGLSINERSRLFNLKKNIVEYSFFGSQFSPQRVENLILETKEVAFHLKSYKCFKFRSRNNFKVNEKFIRKILSYDKFVNEEDKIKELMQKSDRTSSQTIGQTQQQEELMNSNELQSLSIPSIAQFGYCQDKDDKDIEFYDQFQFPLMQSSQYFPHRLLTLQMGSVQSTL